jgi:DNA-binding transcriptional MocR family regulator
MLKLPLDCDHFDRLRRDYAARRGALLRALERAGPEPCRRAILTIARSSRSTSLIPRLGLG